MVIHSIILVLFSNSVTLRRDKSILYSRNALMGLLFSSLLVLGSLYITNLDTGIGLFGGLFHSTSTTHTFHLFIALISAVILQATGFYPRRVWKANYSSISKLFLYNFRYYKNQILNKMGEQFKIIEYPGQQFGKLLFLWGKLPNSGDILKTTVPKLGWKVLRTAL